MAYYTGKDVKVWVCTEHALGGIQLGTDWKLEITDNSADSSPATTNGALEVQPTVTHLGYTGFNLTDVTGVDISIGAQDEEIAYFGTKTPGKIETKNDMSVTITRKKSDRLWSTIAQGTTKTADSQGDGTHGARWGMITPPGGSLSIADGSTDPKSSLNAASLPGYGFRVAVQLKAETASGTDGDVLILRNCTMGEYTTTASNESANDETITFVSMVKPLVLNGDYSGNTFLGGVTPTPAANM
tara:strand:- start:356 stop:1084 length:729 start_codon:yes stop_codon:yes gene_type:complete